MRLLHRRKRLRILEEMVKCGCDRLKLRSTNMVPSAQASTNEGLLSLYGLVRGAKAKLIKTIHRKMTERRYLAGREKSIGDVVGEYNCFIAAISFL